MEIMDIVRENPQYCWIHEFDLSNRLLKETEDDSTIVYDSSTRQYVILSLANLNRVNVVEAAVVHKTLANDGIIYFLKTYSNERYRNKNITQLYANQNLMKRFKRNQESEVRQSLRRIKRNMGEQIV